MADYSKWEKLSREVEAEEEAEKEKEREERRVKYVKEQELKKVQYKEKYGCDPPAPSCCGFASAEQIQQMTSQGKKKKPHKHMHGEKECDGNHDHHESEQDKPVQEELSLEAKNEKKKLAALAAKEDGNKFFQKGDYPLAFQIYERGALILNGMYGLSDAEYDEMFDLEKLLDLNMAACKLKLGEYRECVSHCKMALNLDDKCAKAHYRMGQAYLELGELEKAVDAFTKAQELMPSNGGIKKQIAQINAKIKQENAKEVEFQKKLGSSLVGEPSASQQESS